MNAFCVLLLAGVSMAAPASRVRIGLDAADWRPVSVRLVSGGAGKTSFERQVREGRGRISPARAVARIHPAPGGWRLIVSVYPTSLRKARTHLEARFLVTGGDLQKASISAVTIVGGRYSPQDEKEDSVTLKAHSRDFLEESPSSAHIILSAFNAGAGRANAGRVKDAVFGAPTLGVVNFSWALTQIGDKTGRPKPRSKVRRP